MNQKKESCRRCDELSAEILRLREDNNRLSKDYRKSLDDYAQLQKEFLDYFRKGRKSKECLVVAFRSNRN